MKITALLENTTTKNSILTEHGLSLYIEIEDKKILFDMGQTELFYKNAEVLGFHLKEVDFAVLSRGHYDHGGGLENFLKLNDHAIVYIHKDAFLPYYNAKDKYIGLDVKLKENERIVFVEGEYSISDGVTLVDYDDKPREGRFESFVVL